MTDFLKAAEAYQRLGIPVFPLKPQSKVPLTRNGFLSASLDPDQAIRWWSATPNANIGVVPGSTWVVVDVDGPEGLSELTAAHLELPETAYVETGREGGMHLWFKTDRGVRSHKPFPHIDVKGEGGYLVAPPSIHESGKRYAWKRKLVDAASAPTWVCNGHEGPPEIRVSTDEPIPEGSRHTTLLSLAGSMRDRGMTPDAIAAALKAENAARCRPLLADRDVDVIAKSMAKYEPGNRPEDGITFTDLADGETPIVVETDDAWPAPIDAAAFHGLPGRVVAVSEPFTEADRVALLLNFLTMFGSALGPGPYFPVGADWHRPRLYVVLVGRSSRSRKTSSMSPIRHLFEIADPVWLGTRLVYGLGSGEGLIHAVRDERLDPDGSVVDPGVADKRLLISVAEFATVLKVMQRPGQVLGEQLRQAWDTGTLEMATKNIPVRATGAHVSLLGNITADELRRTLTDTDQVNGFANRVIWPLVRRTKLIPSPPPMEGPAVDAVASDLAEIIDTSRRIGQVRRDPEAEDRWDWLYGLLAAQEPRGLAGELLSRAEAQILRLSLLYALADGSSLIRVPHLMAAEAVWRYVAESVKVIFGASTGDPVADEIARQLSALKSLNRTQLRELFSRHISETRLTMALHMLARIGVVTGKRVKSGGRPSEVWTWTG